MLSPEEYKKKFDQLMNAIWTIQSRIAELGEFEKQWRDLFDLLKSKAGDECRVHILNTEIYRGFRWDKYHVVASDLLSAIENEIQNERSVTRQSIHHLKIHPVEQYSDSDRVMVLPDPNGNPISEADEAKERKWTADFFAKKIRNHHIEVMKDLFPTLGPDQVATKEHLSDLITKLRGMKDEINGLRQIFAHKHQELIVAKHSVGLEVQNIDQLKELADRFFQVVQMIGSAHHRSSYAALSNHCEGSVSDQIDLILFGSITGMHARFYENVPAGTYYWQAREKYFESEHLLSIVAKDSRQRDL